MQFKHPGSGATFALSQSDDAALEKIELWWFVENADAMHAELVARGVEVGSPPVDLPFGRAFSIKDPAGLTLWLLQVPGQG